MAINIDPSHRGLLHKNLGVPAGQRIPEKSLDAARNSPDPAVRKRAVFAENARHWNHKSLREGAIHSEFQRQLSKK